MYPVVAVSVDEAPPLVLVAAAPPPAAAVSLVTVVSDVDVSVVFFGQANRNSASVSTDKSETAFFIVCFPFKRREQSNGSAQKKRPAEAGRFEA